MVSKAGINSQSVNRLDALEEEGGAGLIGADNSNGLTGMTVQAQINELATTSGGGALMKVVDRITATIPAGSPAGLLVSASAVGEGQVLRIRVLGASGSTAESNITVTIDGFIYVSNGSLGGLNTAPTTGNLLVTPNPTSATTSQNTPLLYTDIICKEFAVSKVSFSTVQSIICVYEILEPME